MVYIAFCLVRKYDVGLFDLHEFVKLNVFALYYLYAFVCVPQDLALHLATAETTIIYLLSFLPCLHPL